MGGHINTLSAVVDNPSRFPDAAVDNVSEPSIFPKRDENWENNSKCKQIMCKKKVWFKKIYDSAKGITGLKIPQSQQYFTNV